MPPDILRGTVLSWRPGQDRRWFGFIDVGPDRQCVYCNAADLMAVDRLHVGDVVDFELSPPERGGRRYAVKVRLITSVTRASWQLG